VSLAVVSIGHLVPREDAIWHVHSVFARACNFVRHDLLITLLAAGGDAGPGTLVLEPDERHRDLRALFAAGDAMDLHGRIARTARVELRLASAALWRPAPPCACQPRQHIDAQRRIAAARLAQHRRRASSVIDREAGAVVDALAAATRARDEQAALPSIERLIGWGEGSTPAGDDFLLGWLAALERLGRRDEPLERFARSAGAAIERAAAQRTTALAAHALRLAARGHHGACVVELCDALLCADRADRLDAALERVFALGATSGADIVSGLLSGLSAAPTHPGDA
jgi:hypothetical protein